MTAETVRPNETIVPLLPCTAPDETLAFWRSLGFAVTWEQRKPYLYLATALNEPERVPGWGECLKLLELTPDERDRVVGYVAATELVEPWLPQGIIRPA